MATLKTACVSTLITLFDFHHENRPFESPLAYIFGHFTCYPTFQLEKSNMYGISCGYACFKDL